MFQFFCFQTWINLKNIKKKQFFLIENTKHSIPQYFEKTITKGVMTAPIATSIFIQLQVIYQIILQY